MKTGQLLLVSMLIVLAIAGVAGAAYLMFTQQRYEGALIGAVLMLAAAQLASLFLRPKASDVRKEDLDFLKRAHDNVSHEQAGLRSRIETLERKLAAPREPVQTREAGPRLSGDFRAPRRETAPSTRQAPIFIGPAPLAPPPQAPKAQPQLRDEHLDLYLEPIVALDANVTTHYRAALWLRPGLSPPVGAADLYQSAERGGLRPALDVFALTRVLPVLRVLAPKGRRTQIFVPIGRATLSAPAYVEQMIELLKAAPDVAQHVVLEIEHGAIGHLKDAGIEGLAKLAQAGASLGLGGAAEAGIEFAALRNLGFRTIEFQAGPPGTVPSWINAARIAASQGMDVLAGSVDTAEQAEAVKRWARFGSGAYFAPPRLVRSDLGAEPLKARAAA
jgi:EAL domain-containing protein (putative c-di-GMP-specific phosphodiesterase class I)